MENAATPTPEPAAPTVATVQPPVVEGDPVKPMKAILLGRIHDITEFASVDKTRFVINGLHYSPKFKCLEATDGRVLIQVPVTAPVDEFPEVVDKSGLEEAIIPIAQFKKALSNVPKNGPLPILRHMRVSTSGDKVTMTTTDLDTEQVVKTKAIEGFYPKTEQVVPTEEPKFSVSLNPGLLSKICDYASRHAFPEGSSGSIKFLFTDSISPVRFEIQCKNEMGDLVKATGVLMPMRMS